MLLALVAPQVLLSEVLAKPDASPTELWLEIRGFFES